MKKIVYLVLSLSLLGATSGTLSSCKAKKSSLNSSERTSIKDAYKELKETIPEAKVSMEDDRVKLIFPEAVLFAVNGTEINEQYLPTIGKIAMVLNKHPETSILVAGYTDISGSAETNEKLSWGRAESAKEALLSYEVKNKRVYTWGFGSKNPIATNETAEGRKLNRRVEFVVLYDMQKVIPQKEANQ